MIKLTNSATMYEATQANQMLQDARSKSKQDYQQKVYAALLSSLGPVARGARVVEMARRPSLARDNPLTQINLDYVDEYSTAVLKERTEFDNPRVNRVVGGSIDDVVAGQRRARKNPTSYDGKKRRESYVEQYANPYSYAGRERREKEDRRKEIKEWANKNLGTKFNIQ